MIAKPKLSKIALGTMQFLWTTSEEEAYTILNSYFDLGGNSIDTADMYANWVEGLQGGEAETIIGKWMKRRKNRENIFLTTKVRAKTWEGADGEGLGREHIQRAVDRSLQRLKTDYIDLYLSHWSDPNTPIDETLDAYQQLVQQGKVRFIGCSNYSKMELEEALQVGKRIGTKYAFIQAYYNLIDRGTFEEELVSLIEKYQLHTMIYSPLAGGFLTGAYKKGTQLPTHRRAHFIKEKMTDENLALLGFLEEIGEKYQASVSQIALAWLLDKGYTLIIGADSVSQLKENVGALQVTLKKEDISRLNNVTF